MLDTLFLYVLDMTLKGSLVILAVLLVRLCLRKAPKIFSYALWGVVLLRLLCPFSIQLPVSVLPEMESVPQTYRFESDPITFTDASNAVSQVIGEAYAGSLNTQQIYVDVPSSLGGSRPMAATLWEICLMAGQYLWLAGVGVMLLRTLVHYIFLRKRLIGAVQLKDNIYLVDNIDSPFVMGLFKPRIYLPSTLRERETLYILAHERHHIRRADHIVKLFAFLALSLHWFNPLVWAAYLLACKDMEMSCDEAVLKKLGPDIRADYAASLLSFATGRRVAAFTPLAFGEGDTKSRIQNLAKWKKPVAWIGTICVLVCIITAVCLLTDPTPRADNVVDTPTHGEPQTGGTAVRESFDIVTAYAGYTDDSAFYLAAENSDTFHQSSVLHLPIYRIDTKEQLDTFLDAHGSLFDLDQGYDDVPSINGALERFDEAFFSQNTLALVYVTASSGSYRYDVSSIYCTSDSFCVHVERTNSPQVHTDDMAGWFLMIGVPDTMLSGVTKMDADMNTATLDDFHRPTRQVQVNHQTGMQSLRGVVLKTNMFGLSQKVKDAIASEWLAYDSLSPQQRAYSSRLFGHITFRADTWEQTEEDLGIPIKNPVMDIPWLSPTDVYGGIATSDEILHTETNIYATDAVDRTAERISVSAGYRGNGQRVILSASIFSVTSLFMENVEDAQAELRSYETGSGLEAIISRDSGEKYTAAEATWLEEHTLYSLRVIGEPGQESQVNDTLLQLLKEI